jgi:hypothetical protein
MSCFEGALAMDIPSCGRVLLQKGCRLVAAWPCITCCQGGGCLTVHHLLPRQAILIISWQGKLVSMLVSLEM